MANNKITTADCVKAIVALCADPKVVMAAFCGGNPADYENPVRIQAAMKQMWECPHGVVPETEDFLKFLTKLTTNPKNWKRMHKYKDPSNPVIIERGFDCRPFDDQLRGYVYEKNGVIIDVNIQGE